MVDLLGMFRRRPAKRGKAGFARSREDITALNEGMGDMLRGSVRDAPPLARTVPAPVLELPRVENPAPARQAPAKPPAPRSAPKPAPRTSAAAAPRQAARA